MSPRRTCCECNGSGGHHFTGCPEMPETPDEETTTHDHDNDDTTGGDSDE